MKIKEVRHILTYSCNLRCLHCYLDGGENPLVPAPLTQETLDNFYDFYKPDVVSATGGEPLIDPILVKKIARSTSLYKGSMELVTNGFFLTSELVKELNTINPKTFYQISLDGDENYHNYLRNNNEAFKKAIKAIDLASSSGAWTKVRFTATDENIHTISKIIKILDDFNRKNIKFVMRPVLMRGRGLKNNLKMSKNFSDLDDFASLAKTISIETTDNAGKCGCGIDTIAIDPQGNIFPCSYFMHDLKYKMGSIYNYKELLENEEFKNYKGNCYARKTL